MDPGRGGEGRLPHSPDIGHGDLSTPHPCVLAFDKNLRCAFGKDLRLSSCDAACPNHWGKCSRAVLVGCKTVTFHQMLRDKIVLQTGRVNRNAASPWEKSCNRTQHNNTSFFVALLYPLKL